MNGLNAGEDSEFGKPTRVGRPEQLRMLDAFSRHAVAARRSTTDRVERKRDCPIADGMQRHRDASRPGGNEVRIQALGGQAHDAQVTGGREEGRGAGAPRAAC